MYTAKIQRKDYVNGAIRVFVEFTNGTETVVENCIPQNEDGLKFWIKSRLETFNSAPTIESKYADGADVDVSDPVVVPHVPTAGELARAEWLKRYFKYVKVKTTLVDTGVLPADNAQVTTLRTWLTSNVKPEYLDYI